jgi:hypothetical protein
MSLNNAGPRGGARGRGRGRGNGARKGPSATSNSAPLAAQMKQLDRLAEPDEVAVLRNLGAFAHQIRSIYGRTGLLSQEVRVSREDAVRGGLEPSSGDHFVWISRLEAEGLKATLSLVERDERRVARRSRLSEDRREVRVSDLTAQEIRLLDMSNKEFDNFRARA